MERRYRSWVKSRINNNLKRPKSVGIGFAVSHIWQGVVALLNLVSFFEVTGVS
jgi:hypothetical protein